MPDPTPRVTRYDPPEFPIRITPTLALLALLPLLALAGVGYWWFVQRVEVPAGHVLVLLRKWGEPLPPEAGDNVVLYPALLEKLGEPPDSTRYKGIMYEVKPEGRHFYDPLFWERKIVPAIVTGPDEIGLLIRKYGYPLPPGKLVATEPHERGPLLEFIPPGVRTNLNPYAYEVKAVPRVRIPEGSVGVQTLFAGPRSANPNRYVVDPGEAGVQPTVLPPGLYNVNPYEKRVDVIDTRSHTIDFRDKDAIHFPSKDSFDILIEGTVEYAIQQERAPYVMAAIGDHEDVINKLILPFMRSLARIEGSKLEAREFISGDTRKAFQQRVFEGLHEQSGAQGVEIRAALIRRIEPPAAIANPISDRQLADQQIRLYQTEIERARAEADLAAEAEMQRQNQEIGQARREVVSLVTEAQQRMAVALTEANKRLEVAKLKLEAARATAEAIRSRGQADAQVVRLNFEAKAGPLAEAVQAFGGGEAYAQYYFYQKLAPSLKHVLDSTEGPFADIFRSLSERMPASPPPSLSQTAARSASEADRLPGGAEGDN